MRATVRAVGLLSDSDPTVLPAAASAADFAGAARQALTGDCDSVICAAVRVFDGGPDPIRQALAGVAAAASKPLVAVLLGFQETSDDATAPDRPGDLPAFDAPVAAISALAAVSAYARWRDRDLGAVPLLDVNADAARRLVHGVLAGCPDGRELTDKETTELLKAYGIELVPLYPVANLEHAVEVAERLGWNVVLKATAQAVRGRPDLAGVRRNLDRPEELVDAWDDLTDLVRELGLSSDEGLAIAEPVVQAMVPTGVALVITSREDRAFGPIVSLGLDGIPSELLGDIVYRVPPLTTVDAAAMVRDLGAAPTLFGRHGSPGVDVEAIQDLLHRVAQLADDVPQLASLTLRPCVAALRGVAVLGARAVIAPTADRRDPLARTL